MLNTPQTEDGYTRIANELLDAIVAFDFSKRQYAVLFAVIRKTYGFNKKSDALSIWQISTMTGIDRSHVSKAVAELVSMSVLIKSENGRFAHGQIVPEISINKQYKKWRTDAKTATVKTDAKTARVTDAEIAPVPKQHQCQNSPTTDAKTATPPMPKQLHHLCQNSTLIKTTPKDNSKRQLPKDISHGTDSTAIAVAEKDKFNPAETALQTACKKTWRAYSDAYMNRYGIEPKRNARVSSIIKQFVQRIGMDESPEVATFYVSHNESFYVKKTHTVEPMLRDAEGLRTQWATGRSMTSAKARQIDATQTNLNAVEQALSIMGSRGAA